MPWWEARRLRSRDSKLLRAALPASPPSRPVLSLNLGLIQYVTDNRTQGAAVVFALLLLTGMLFIILIGAFQTEHVWLERVFEWAGGAFLFVTGVAIGESRS
jgi:hypothetical membrane protein